MEAFGLQVSYRSSTYLGAMARIGKETFLYHRRGYALHTPRMGAPIACGNTARRRRSTERLYNSCGLSITENYSLFVARRVMVRVKQVGRPAYDGESGGCDGQVSQSGQQWLS